MIQVVAENDGISYKAAKDIVVGDQIWNITWSELVDESMGDYAITTSSMTDVQRVKSSITAVTPKSVSRTMIINNDYSLRFSLEQQIMVKDATGYRFKISSAIEIGDIVFNVDENGTVSEIIVSSTQIIDDNRTVYKFDAEPTDTIIAGNIICHNIKAAVL